MPHARVPPLHIVDSTKLPERKPILVDAGVELYATDACAAKLKAAAKAQTLAGLLGAHLAQIKAGDYFATLAFLPMFPGQKLSFGVAIDAQAGGDLAVLESRGRRALRVHLGADVAAGLKTLAAAVDQALA